jgi:F0F1-type ATP synthase membrane subunit c/vacuolar-type H+-ATPase subunit K
LSTGGFSYIGLGCLGTAIAAAIAMAKAMREIPQDDR